MFKNFCHCNAAISDLYDGKSKNKIAIIFFSKLPWLKLDLHFCSIIHFLGSQVFKKQCSHFVNCKPLFDVTIIILNKEDSCH